MEEVTIHVVLEGTWSLASWSHWAGFQFSTGLHYQWRKHAGTPKYVFMVHETALLDVGACVRWLETGIPTRLWTIQYIMVIRAFARKTLVLVQPSCHHCVWFPCHTSEYYIMGHFFIAAGAQRKFNHFNMLEESTGFGFICCLVVMLRLRCVFMERHASVLGAVSASVRVWPLVV